MGDEEKIAYEYLVSVGKSPRFEPEGNRPPDFELEDGVAVEVRRLNQHVGVNGQLEPVEKFEYRLVPRLINTIDAIPYRPDKPSFFYSLRYSRGFKPSKKFFGQVLSILVEYLDSDSQSMRIDINQYVHLKLHTTQVDFDKNFVLGSIQDGGKGGFVVGDTKQALGVILQEKAKKVEPYLKEYDEWWLVLVDFIGYGVRDLEKKHLMIPREECAPFTKVILLAPLNPLHGVDIVSPH